ncbi:MAG: deoxyribodipyrimidine photo-lyase [Gammaproteobacteria bacterium]
MTTIVWFRQDLRLADNPALDAAVKRGEPIIPLYIWAPGDDGDWPPGAASRWWLHHSLEALDESLRERGSRLILAEGPASTVLAKLAGQTGATAAYWNRRYEPAAIACSATVKKSFASRGVQTASFNSTLLAEPWDILNLSGKPYRVYTPYMRRMVHDLDPSPVLRTPAKLKSPSQWPQSASLPALNLIPRIEWCTGIADRWRPGEEGAQARLERFLANALAHYNQDRDKPAVDGTSGLSPHLHFGEIGPRQIWHALGAKGRNSTFLHELIWREFAYHLLYHFPETTTKPLRPEFAAFPWKKNPKQLKAWQRGHTGVPMVDAGMRELWTTGVMHNRVRMIVGSFLVKNLLQPWQEGARWFWDTLVDADLAANTLNWQWVAGSGADAAPYFRIFNPVTQGERFDPEGEYVRRWVPEVAGFANHAIHGPWRKSRRNLKPGPEPLVDLAESREAALDAYADMRRRAKP